MMAILINNARKADASHHIRRTISPTIFGLLILPICVGSMSVQAEEDLFAALDKNRDGRVTADEISDSQKPYFERALRVSDRNEDGLLTRDELAVAVSNPKPVTVSASGFGGNRANLDFKALDRNRDGYLAKDEVPEFLKERLKPALDRYGADGIPMNVLEGMARMMGSQPGARPALQDSKAADMMKSAESNKPADEMKSADDPKASADSKAAMRPRASTRQATDDAGDFFRRLDTDKDGKLSRDEIPQRLRQNMKQADTNKDGSLSKEELVQAMRNRDKNP